MIGTTNGRHLTPGNRHLLAFLQRRGEPDGEKLMQVERWASIDGIPLIEALQQKGVMREDEIAEMLARELRLPLLDLDTAPFAPDVVKLLRESIASQFTVIPVRAEDQTLILAMANPLDQEATKTVEFVTGRQVRPTVARRSQVLDAIDRHYKFDTAVSSLLTNVPLDGDLTVVTDVPPRDHGDLRSLSRSAEQAPIVKMVNLILGEAVKSKASDIHVEPGPNVTLVRYRVNGVLEDVLEIPRWVQSPVVARVKVMSKLDITERRVPQDGGLRVRFKDRVVDLRVSSLPTAYGEKIVMRVLDPGVALRRIDTIGLSPRDARVLRAAIQKPEGMILVTGPTGSGKTTTLYAIIQELLSPDLNIVTIENPIEYEIKGVSQVQVNEKQGLTFAGALRSILRQDPDVILLGEIRDRETAEVAFQAAQTGHLVLSSLHTNDSFATITRLLDLEIEPYLIASSLLAVVAQRLVRTVCSSCGEPTVIDDETRAALGLKASAGFRSGKGCSSCRKTGYESRVGVFEVLPVSKAMRQMIESKAPESSMRQLAHQEAVTNLVEDAATKIETGITTPDEVLRVVHVDTQTPRCPACASPVEERFTICPYCQSQLRLTCGSCKATLRPEWKTCPYCGALPQTAAPHAAATAPERPAPPAAPADARPRPEAVNPGEITVPRVLVVDDNEDLRIILRSTLENCSTPMQVDEATNGFEALGKVEIEKPHLIILDLMMPGTDGFEVCKRLRANLETALIPIIMLTAREDAEARLHGFMVGTDDYLVKPFDRREIVARVNRLLERTYRLNRAACDPTAGGTTLGN